MRTLAFRHGSRNLPIVPNPSHLFKQLSALESKEQGSFIVFVSSTRGKAVCVTKELLLELALFPTKPPPASSWASRITDFFSAEVQLLSRRL